MRAVVISQHVSKGPIAPHVKLVDDWPDLSPPGPCEVNLRIECSALNHMDLWVARGIPKVKIDYPKVSGVDACGIVEDLGEGVDESWRGQRVVFNAAVALPNREVPTDPPVRFDPPDYILLGEHTQGAHAEKFQVPVTNLAPVGDRRPEEAAGIGVVFVTAYSMMMTKAQLHAGQSVLITGIGGGVSTAALALARWKGCPVVVTSRAQDKLDKARELGADHTVLDTGQDWSRDVRAWAGKRGVDVAIDTVGAATHLNCIKSLARGGALVIAGATSGAAGQADIARIFWNQLRVLGSTMGSNAEFREVVSLYRQGHVSPVIDSTYDAADAAQAWSRLEQSQQMGKILLRWSISA